MQLATSILLVFSALGLQGALATPILDDPKDIGPLNNTSHLFPRAGTGNDQSDPIEAELRLDGDKMNMLPFEADCWAILCMDAPDVLQRVNDRRIKANRRTSGVCGSPFKKKKLSIPPRHPKWGDFVSPEEYPFASSLQGGTKAYLIPVSLPSQNSQGGTLNGLLSKYKIRQFDPESTSPGASDGTWYKIKYTGNLGPYCDALMRGDKSVCQDNFDGSGEWGFDVAKWAYQYDKPSRQYKRVGKN